ncbi:MAG: nucleotidyltransferase family protein, partial [Flavobacterium sp.]
SHTVAQAMAVNETAVIVVTGANDVMITTELKNTGAMSVYNPDWEQGMGSSVRIGLESLLKAQPAIQHCIITVCDQPFISSEILMGLVEKQKFSGSGIVASAYVGTLGTPVLFTSPYFEKLLSLSGQDGAKKLVEEFIDDVASLPFEKGAVDIDTIEDYNQLLNMQ